MEIGNVPYEYADLMLGPPYPVGGFLLFVGNYLCDRSLVEGHSVHGQPEPDRLRARVF